jgi:alpha-tubulin suppressor-like RCC1 family protein
MRPLIPNRRHTTARAALLSATLASAALFGCAGDAPTHPPAVATVAVVGGAVLEPGDSARVLAEARAASGGPVPGTRFAWASSSPDVATVDSAGWVRARAAGTATITAVATGGAGAGAAAPSGTVVMAVQPRARTVVLDLPDSLGTGDTVRVRAVALDALGTPMPPATPVAFAWASQDTAVATIDATGRLVAHRAGRVAVTAEVTGPPDAIAAAGAPTGRASVGVRLVVADLAGGSYHTCAVARGGLVHCWGEGAWGRLGTGVAYGAWRTVALPTAALTAVRFVSVAGDGQQDSRSGHTCAVTATAEVYCWGSGAWGMLGDGRHGENFPPPSTAMPTRVAGVPAVRAAALGGSHTCVLATGGEVWCAGSNHSGQIGAPPSGSTCEGLACVLRFQPVPGTRFQALAAGTHHNCGLTEGGEARCWGSGWSGQLGTGVREQRSTPTPVPALRFGALAAGGSTTCGVALDGTAHCWGEGYMGQVGSGVSGSGGATLAPTRVDAPERLAQVVVGPWMHACGLTSAGVAYCWGNNMRGQLGAATTQRCGEADRDGQTFLRGACSTRPVAVATPLRFARLALGADHTCGLTAAGAVYCWGANDRGQLGTGDADDRPTPTLVPGFR